MAGGSDTATTTTTQTPPGYLQGPLQNIVSAATGLSGLSSNTNGGFSGKDAKRFARLQRLREKGKRFGVQEKLEGKLGLGPGQSPSPFANISGFGGLGDLSGGAGLLPQAQDLTSQTLAGDFLGPDSNPYLMDIFNRGADTIQQRLQSNFAGAGRNVQAGAAPARQEFSDLFANLFGGNYQQERTRQQGAITNAQGLDPINQLINRLAGVIPGAGGVTTSQQPVYNTGLF